MLLSLPVFIMVICYIIIDPFKVIWDYDLYYQSDDFIQLNRGFVSAKHYANHHNEYHYNSYIFGNSRSIVFHEKEWKKYIPKTSVCYHFDAFGGGVKELYYEIKYVSERDTLKNALLILDHELLSTNENEGILLSLPPILKNGKGTLKFQLEYFMAFYKIDFFLSYIDYRMNKEFDPNLESYFIKPNRRMGYDPINNELFWEQQEESIEKGTYYDSIMIKHFDYRQSHGKVVEPAINDERMEMLKEIKSIFNAQKTDYKIVISPLYAQKKLNPIDLQILYDIFDQNNVFDFSGVNKWTSDYHNYYEISHYRSCVANEIMQIVYSEK